MVPFQMVEGNSEKENQSHFYATTPNAPSQQLSILNPLYTY